MSHSKTPTKTSIARTISKEECINFLRHGYASI